MRKEETNTNKNKKKQTGKSEEETEGKTRKRRNSVKKKPKEVCKREKVAEQNKVTLAQGSKKEIKGRKA